jgi:glycosyltransferase involved in cell wall biosynthesis
MEATRVVHIAPTAFGAGGIYGGGERYPYELARAMARLVPTRLVTFGDVHNVRRDHELTVEVLPVRTRYQGAEVNPLSERIVAPILRADVVHVHQWSCLLANVVTVVGRGAGKTVVATDHGGSAKNYRKQLRLHRLLHRFLPVSAFSGAQFPELSDRTEIIYGGVDTDRFRPVDPQGRLEQALFVGRLLPHKGVDLLIDALPASVKLVVMGRVYDDSYFAYLTERAAHKDVEFRTDATDGELVEAYQKSRVVVLPSIYDPRMGGPAKQPELLPLTLLEAMACGTPVVCTDVGGMPELVEHGVSGFVVAPHDLEALAQAVTGLVKGTVDWESMSGQALEKARAMSWTALAERCLDAYGLAG